MKRNLAVQGFALCFVLLAFAGCTVSRAAEAEKMYILGSALTKLSASVEATVRYEDPPEGIGDMELLILSTKHDPGLLGPFTDYTVCVSRQDGHAVVLMCDKDGKIGLLEDAGCSRRWTGICGRRIPRSRARSPWTPRRRVRSRRSSERSTLHGRDRIPSRKASRRDPICWTSFWFLRTCLRKE